MAGAAHASQFLARNADLADQTLLALQVTTRSTLGAIAYETGGVSIADGVLRLLGSGDDRSLLRLNRQIGGMNGTMDDFVLVADEPFGGLFAINGGRFGAEGIGNVFFLPADDLTWLDTEVGYSDFVSWCLTGDHRMLLDYPASEAFSLPPAAFSKSWSIYPYPWTVEGKGSVDARLVPADELVGLRIELAGFGI